MNTDKIEIKDLYLVFGHDKQKALKMLRKGKTKQEILKETDRIVAEAGREKLIIGSDCTLPGDIEPWRIRRVIDYAHTL